MKTEFVARRLDVTAFARAGGEVAGREPLAHFERLAAEVAGVVEGREVVWSVRGEWREQAGDTGQAWLHLVAEASLPMTCQRCLGPADIALEVDRDFRFVADEATAEAEDDESEEDLLVLARDFDVLALVEDELLMALPVVPRHDVCPAPLKMSVADPQAEVALEEAEKAQANPFAALAQLRTGKGQ